MEFTDINSSNAGIPSFESLPGSFSFESYTEQVMKARFSLEQKIEAIDRIEATPAEFTDDFIINSSQRTRARFNSIRVTSRGEEILGTDGRDKVNARPSRRENLIRLGNGNDRTIGGNRDVFLGEAGADRIDLRRGKGRNVADGGEDNDRLFARNRDTLIGGSGNDRLDSRKGRKSILAGEDGNDRLFAGKKDRLFGEAGNDRLDSRRGIAKNLLDGGDGNDRLFAGNKRDTLIGGAGADQFWLATKALPKRAHIIADFEVGTDLIRFKNAGVTRFEDLFLTQVEEGTVLSANGTVIALLIDVQASTLSARDFSFIPVFNPPPVVRLALANDSGLSNTDRLTADSSIIASIADLDGITQVQAGINGMTAAEFVDVTQFFNNGVLSLTQAQQQAIFGSRLTEGFFSIVITATDTQGNQSDPAVLFAQLDQTAPSLSAELGLNGRNLSVPGFAGDLSEVTQLAIGLGNTPVENFTSVANLLQPSGGFEILEERLAELNGGEFQEDTPLTIIAADEHGQISSPVNLTIPALIETVSTLKYYDLEEGTGEAPETGQTVTVNYTGLLEDNTVFDSSRDPGDSPFSFTIDGGRVIAGFNEGIANMKVGGRRLLIIPPELGYGERGSPPNIPPNATIYFDVELLSIA